MGGSGSTADRLIAIATGWQSIERVELQHMFTSMLMFDTSSEQQVLTPIRYARTYRVFMLPLAMLELRQQAKSGKECLHHALASLHVPYLAFVHALPPCGPRQRYSFP